MSEKRTTKAAISEAAAVLGRKGGLKGGPARAKKLSARRRRSIARLGAEAANKVKAAKRKAAEKGEHAA